MSEKKSFQYFKEYLKSFRGKISKPFKKPYLKLVLVVFALVLAPLIYMSVRRGIRMRQLEEIVEEEEVPMVKALRVSKQDYSDKLDVIGSVRGVSEIGLKFEIDGRIKSFNFREGDSVREGEVIVSLDPEDIMTRLDHAKSKLESVAAKYESAKEQYEVHRDLFDMGAIIRARLREVELNKKSLEAEVRSARSEVRMAQSELNKTVITAPSDGIMGERHVSRGDYVTPNDEVGGFLEVDDVYVEAGIIEREVQKVSVGQEAKVTFDAYPDRVFTGVVDNIARFFRGETRTLPIQIKIGNPELMLYSGMLASCEIMLKELNDVIMVPSDSIIDLGDMEVVPLILMGSENRGEVELRKVVPGYERGDMTEIREGLDEGDVIVEETQHPLRDGLQVNVIEISEIAED